MSGKSLLALVTLSATALGLSMSPAQGPTKGVSSIPVQTPLSDSTTVIYQTTPIGRAAMFDVSTLSEKTVGVVDAPYSAVGTTETVRFVDGNRMVETEFKRFFRDSQGRFRQERLMSTPFPEGSGQELGRLRAEPVHVEIWDPVRGESYTLDTRSKTFQRIPVPTSTSMPIHPPVEPPPLYISLRVSLEGGSPLDPDELRDTVSLGEKSIEGISVVGSRLVRLQGASVNCWHRFMQLTCRRWRRRMSGHLV